MLAALWDYWLWIDEPLGTALGLLIVWCFIRENIWAWPLGVAYVLVLVSGLVAAQLYANLALHLLVYLPMNLYGWYYWRFGKRPDQAELPVTRAGPALLAAVLAVCAAGTGGLGVALMALTDAALPFWDSAIFVSSIATMWLTARKKIENWIFWFVIDVVQVGVYWERELYWYAGLYFVYLGMAVAGWRAWQRSRENAERIAAELGTRP